MTKSKKTETAKLTDWQRNYRPPKDGFGADFAKAMVANLRAAAPAQDANRKLPPSSSPRPRIPRGPR